MHRFTPRRLAFLWSLHNTLLELPRMAGTPTRTLRYEQFARDPETVLREVAEFAGLPLGADDLRFLEPGVVHLSMSHQVAGNPMRFNSGRLELRVDSAWREKMAPKDRRTVTVLTAPLLAAYGYLGRRRR